METQIDKKYYTPSISEFHIGFECEKYDRYFNGTIPVSEWRKHIIEEEDFDSLSAYLRIQYRVKYLDREDIESFGFKVIKTQDNSIQARIYFKYDIKATGIEDNNVEGYIEIIKSGDMWCRIGEECMGFSTLFAGTINNISELKKILIMLGIDKYSKEMYTQSKDIDWDKVRKERRINVEKIIK